MLKLQKIEKVKQTFTRKSNARVQSVKSLPHWKAREKIRDLMSIQATTLKEKGVPRTHACVRTHRPVKQTNKQTNKGSFFVL